jgi:hypothetical protein
MDVKTEIQKVKELTQGHVVIKMQTKDSNPGCLAPGSFVLAAMPRALLLWSALHGGQEGRSLLCGLSAVSSLSEFLCQTLLPSVMVLGL